MKKLTAFKCVACRGDTPPISIDKIANLLPEIPEWQLIEVEGIARLERVFLFKNFAEALDFTNRVSVIAGAEDHHPHIALEWGRVTIQWWTYAINGLHRNDLIMAAKTDAL